MGTTAEKLTYLNDTKQLLKENINSLGGNLTTEPFRQYASVLEGIYERIPKVSGIGTNLSLSPTMVGKIKLNEIQGNTLQDGTPTPDSPVEIQSVTGLQNVEVCGKNLLNIPNGTYSHNGITAVVDNGEITLNGTASGTSFIGINVGLSLNSGNFVLSNNNSETINDNSTYIRFDSDSNTICTFLAQNVSKAITLSSNTNYSQLVIRTTSGISFENFIIKPQLEKGQATTYEPYKGNTYEVNLGKNLFDENYTGITSNLTYKSIYVGDGTFILSTTAPMNTTGGANLFFLSGNVSSGASTGTNGVYTNRPIQRQSENGYVTIAYRNTLGVNPEDYDTQLEKGSQATSYSKYFTPIELNKIGDYQDRIYKDNGKWYIEKQIGKVVLNGSETYTSGSTNTSGVYRIRTTAIANLIKTPSSAGVNGDALSNYFGITTANQNYQCVQGFGVETSGALVFYDSGGNTQTTSAFTTWLSTHNTEVLYALATPEYTEITNTELIEDLETLYTAKSQEGTTNISITSEDLEMILNVSALKGDA